MTGRERVTEHPYSGRRYRVREFGSGGVTVERLEHDGWELLDDDAAAAVLARLRDPDVPAPVGSTPTVRASPAVSATVPGGTMSDDKPMPLHEASAVLRGKRGVTTPDDRARATARVVAALDRQHLVSIWSRRLLDATDDAAAERARRRLREALDNLGA